MNFKLDKKELKQLQKFNKRAPKQFAFASKILLNDLSFGVRKEAVNMVDRKMTVRSKGFVKSSIRVEKVKGNNINRMQAIVGSIYRPRFNGWREQELGTSTKRKRVLSQESRGGNWSKTSRQATRLKSSNQFDKSNEFQGMNSNHRTIAMIRQKARTKDRKPFIVTGHKRIKSGVYKIKQSKLVMLQNFEPSKVQPRRNPWLRPAALKYMGSVNMRAKWSRAINIALKPKK